MKAVEYVVWWLNAAREVLQNDPANDLHIFTHVNYSGGIRGWEEGIDQIYFRPASAEERQLRCEVHEVLLTAFRNVARMAEKLEPQKWHPVRCMAVEEAYRLAQMIGRVDPLNAVLMKIQLNQMCKKFRKTFFRLNTDGIETLLVRPEQEIVW